MVIAQQRPLIQGLAKLQHHCVSNMRYLPEPLEQVLLRERLRYAQIFQNNVYRGC
jgi:hypothetical protein